VRRKVVRGKTKHGNHSWWKGGGGGPPLLGTCAVNGRQTKEQTDDAGKSRWSNKKVAKYRSTSSKGPEADQAGNQAVRAGAQGKPLKKPKQQVLALWPYRKGGGKLCNRRGLFLRHRKPKGVEIGLTFKKNRRRNKKGGGNHHGSTGGWPNGYRKTRGDRKQLYVTLLHRKGVKGVLKCPDNVGPKNEWTSRQAGITSTRKD